MQQPLTTPANAQPELDGRALARARRASMQRRARRIRRSVAGLSLGLFTAAFLAVYVQLASGHDPALTANAKRRATTSSTSAVSSKAAKSSGTTTTSSGAKSSSATPSTSESSSSGQESSSESSSSSSPSSVTTSQS